MTATSGENMAHEVFRSLETLFREARFLVDGNNVEELRVIDNLSFSVAKLMSIESQWEAMVLEGDILEKSYSNIGNNEAANYIVCCLPYSVQAQFPLKVQKNVLDDMEKCLLEMMHFHAHLKDRSSVLDELIRELQKIEPAIDPSHTSNKRKPSCNIGSHRHRNSENFKRNGPNSC